MAFIRRVRTASGATAVQIAEYVAGRQRIVEHVGSAHTEAELGVLLERARGLLEDPAQGVLDLGVEPVPPVEGLVPPARDPGLFEPPAPSLPRGRARPARVVGTDSRLLFSALAGVFTVLGFDSLGDEVFRDLVLARVVEPTSLLDSGRVLRDLGRDPASYSTMKRALARAEAEKYRDRIASWCFRHATAAGDVSLVLYDVTTLYFEAEKEDELRKVGYSKERRVDPQIVVGLLVDRAGFPLEIGCFEGNKAETATIIPIVKRFQARHGLADMVVVADAGMLSASNLRELDDAGLRFIVGSRMTKAPTDLASHFRWNGNAFTDGQLIDTITPRTGHRNENSTDLRAEPVWDPTQHPGSWRAVWAYSQKRAVRDGRTLTAQENRAREVIDGNKPARTPRFVKTTGGKPTLDEASLARARELAGLKGYVTNIPAALMP
ncbi:IS1634 family transposase, partial [Sinomonas sp. B1-1]|uniref:IS1634 family transposase n=1 Tax=Sinomonas sp. B1-1 TaxID=3141454 RepID=UPI003D2A055F